jgi:predicted AAA+ superfamily ATPase
MAKERYLHKIIHELCFHKQFKMAFIAGPRQAGKTTFANTILKERGQGAYYNWDETKFRRLWIKEPQKLVDDLEFKKSVPPIIILDEIHKAKLWKRNLKGIFDSLTKRVDILVTGSARLNIYQKGSDSLMGRYFLFRLHPFTVAELVNSQPNEPETIINALNAFELDEGNKEAQEIFDNLWQFSGFPEPFLAQSTRRANAWRRMRLQQLVREDLRDLSRLPELSQVEMLLSLLPERVGSQLSRSSIREDLEVAHTTINRWLNYLEALYYHFEIKPYSKSIKRSLKKEGKLYLWDYAEDLGDSARFENLVAQHLLKACHYWTDAGYGNFELMYLRDIQGYEIDFLIIKNKKPWLPVEVKLSETSPSANWKTFLPQLPCDLGVQIVKEPKSHLKIHSQANKRIIVCDANRFLSKLV